MRYCKACNTNNWDEANFCAHCGQSLENTLAPTPEPIPKPKPATSKLQQPVEKKAEGIVPDFTTTNMTFVSSLGYKYKFHSKVVRAIDWFAENILGIHKNIVFFILTLIYVIIVFFPVWLVCQILGLNSHHVVAPSDWEFANMPSSYEDSGLAIVRKKGKYGLAYLLSKPAELWIPMEYDSIDMIKKGKNTTLICKAGGKVKNYILTNDACQWFPWSITKVS